MEGLKIYLFGHILVVHATASPPLKLSRSSQALFAYLLLHRNLIPQDVLMDVFWRDYSPDRARSNLATALWRLRRLLEPPGMTHGTYLVSRKSGEVGFNWDSTYWLDSESFEKRTLPSLRQPISKISEDTINSIEEAVALYRGDLLEGLYEDWALQERERFRSLHLTCLTRLMQYYANQKEHEQSIVYAHEILRRDPLHEETQRALMRAYLESGQYTLALRQYDLYRAMLGRELDIAPLEETQILYQQIIVASQFSILPLTPIVIPRVAQLIHDVQSIKQRLAEINRDVEYISRIVESLAVGGGNPVMES